MLIEDFVISDEIKNYFLRINNRDAFLIDDIPTLHPDSTAYVEYWRDQKTKCIEGLWAQDTKDINSKGDWRWMPPNLYFYVNHGKILHNEPDAPKTAPKKTIRPYLRDVEWEFFYNFMVCRGFSGFKEDDEISCNRDIPLYRAGKIDYFELHKSCINSKGEVKKYEDARSYLKRLHDKPLGKAWFENQALNLFMLGARGFGKSYMVGVGVVLWEILFDGAREYTQESIDNPYKVECFVGAAAASYSADILSKTKYAMENLDGGWAEGTEHYIPPPFFKEMAGSLGPNNKKNRWRHEYKKEVNGSWKTFGSGSNVVHGIYAKDNAEAAVGTRPGVMVVEEVGLMSHLLEVHGNNVNCMREGTVKFGTGIYLGTGGNIEKIREPERIFRAPKTYKFLDFKDIWERSGDIGWFVPAYYSLNQFKDENGNTKLERAFNWLKRTRQDLIDENASSIALEKEMMSMPVVPSEMFLTKTGNIFPVPEIRQRLVRLNQDNTFELLQKKCRLIWDHTQQSGVRYSIDTSGRLKPIDEYPWNDTDREGAFIIYEAPIKDASGKVPEGLYIFGHDPYAIDGEGESLGSFFVFKTGKYPQYGHEELVAEYIARPFAGRNAFNEMMEKAVELYGASPQSLYFENVRGNTKEYFGKRKKLKYLCRRPRTVLSKTVKRASSVIEYGYPMTSKEMKLEAIRMLRDWLLEERIQVDGRIIRNLDLIPSRRLLMELASFNMDENFDCVMGFAACIIGLRERENELKNELIEETKHNPMSFFNNNSRLFKTVKYPENRKSIYRR